MKWCHFCGLGIVACTMGDDCHFSRWVHADSRKHMCEGKYRREKVDTNHWVLVKAYAFPMRPENVLSSDARDSQAESSSFTPPRK